MKKKRLIKEKPKPCPHCNRTVEIKHEKNLTQNSICYISCDCGITFGLGGKEENNLIDAWNNGYVKLFKGEK